MEVWGSWAAGDRSQPHSGGLDGGGIVSYSLDRMGAARDDDPQVRQSRLPCAAATALTPRDEFPLAELVFAGAAISVRTQVTRPSI